MKRKLGLILCLAMTLALPLQGLATAQQDESFAPRVVDHLPYGGQELPLDGAIDVFFDQPMDAASVEGAFSLEPPVAGSWLWLDAATMRFQPDAPLARGTQYQVTIDASATARRLFSVGRPSAGEWPTGA